LTPFVVIAVLSPFLTLPVVLAAPYLQWSSREALIAISVAAGIGIIADVAQSHIDRYLKAAHASGTGLREVTQVLREGRPLILLLRSFAMERYAEESVPEAGMVTSDGRLIGHDPSYQGLDTRVIPSDIANALPHLLKALPPHQAVYSLANLHTDLYDSRIRQVLVPSTKWRAVVSLLIQRAQVILYCPSSGLSAGLAAEAAMIRAQDAADKTLVICLTERIRAAFLSSPLATHAQTVMITDAESINAQYCSRL
jgi:hypothetical protein